MPLNFQRQYFVRDNLKILGFGQNQSCSMSITC